MVSARAGTAQSKASAPRAAAATNLIPVSSRMTKAGQFTMPPPENGKCSISRINFRMEREPNVPGPRFPPADKKQGIRCGIKRDLEGAKKTHYNCHFRANGRIDRKRDFQWRIT